MENRSGAQIAAMLVRLAKAIARVIKAAAAAGAPGAILAAVKEALPFIVKLVLISVFSMMVFAALIAYTLPNVLFGFEGVEDEKITDMTAATMSVGASYVSAEELENNAIDSAVTSIAAEYEERGIEIDKITVINSFSDEDILWLTAVNSVWNKQDLAVMNTEGTASLCSSRLMYDDSIDGTTLYVTVSRLEPDEWMQSLGFTEDDKIWAKGMHDLMSEGDFLNTYGSYYGDFHFDHSGDSSYSGEYLHGDDFSNEIDVSGFVNPAVKNNLDLVNYVTQAWENNWGYVWGTVGNVLTPSVLEYKAEQYSDGVGIYEDFIREHWLGRRTADCIGLVKGYGWFDADTGKFGYETNGVPDYGANDMYRTSVQAGAESGMMEDMPEIPGLILWKQGHTGVYIGGGYAIEAMGTKWGVVKTEVNGRGWEAWYKLPYFEYYD